MDSQVQGLDELKQEGCPMTDLVQVKCVLTREDEKGPSEEAATTDKSGPTNPSGNQDTLTEEHGEAKISSAQIEEIQQLQNDELTESKCVQVKQEPNVDGGEDANNDNDDAQNGDNKQGDNNQEVEEDEEEEEEVEDKDDGDDKMEIEKSAKDPDNQDGSQFDDKLSYLGRNRRVRQKNRYFLDFHCVDLTKGARSNRDDYDAFTTTTTGTRSSNRRSTTDSTRGLQEEGPEVFETRYCRKCSSKTPHDFDGGCQACLYKKIVESSKRQKPSSQRNRSSASKQQNDNELESTSSSATPAPPPPNKRKSNKQGGSAKNKYLNQKYRNIADSRSDSSNDNNNGSNNNVGPASHQAPALDITPSLLINTIIGPETIVTENNCSSGVADGSSNNNHINNNNNIDKLPKLDSWTPDEVAEYIMSKGFAHEAELFKTQSVDGISLLLMQRIDFTYGLKIKLGPALKIYDQVCKLKREYFKTVPVSQH